jgi:hypothetical protein
MVLILFCLAVLSIGCYVARPNFRHPGYLREQQTRATIHDPYGDVNVAPDTAGARPIDYRVPRTPPTKSQWYLDQVGGF